MLSQKGTTGPSLSSCMNGDETKPNTPPGFRVRVLGLPAPHPGSFCNVWVLGGGGCGLPEKCPPGLGRARRACPHSWSATRPAAGTGLSGRKKACLSASLTPRTEHVLQQRFSPAQADQALHLQTGTHAAPGQAETSTHRSAWFMKPRGAEPNPLTWRGPWCLHEHPPRSLPIASLLAPRHRQSPLFAFSGREAAWGQRGRWDPGPGPGSPRPARRWPLCRDPGAGHHPKNKGNRGRNGSSVRLSQAQAGCSSLGSRL